MLHFCFFLHGIAFPAHLTNSFGVNEQLLYVVRTRTTVSTSYPKTIFFFHFHQVCATSYQAHIRKEKNESGSYVTLFIIGLPWTGTFQANNIPLLQDILCFASHVQGLRLKLSCYESVICSFVPHSFRRLGTWTMPDISQRKMHIIRFTYNAVSKEV